MPMPFEHDLETSRATEQALRRGCSGAQSDFRSRKRSWRTIEPGGAHTQGEPIQPSDHPLPWDIEGFDFDRVGKDACEKSVQRAAIIPIGIAMMGNGSRIILSVHVLMMLVRSDGRLKARRSGQRRRHYPRELSDQKQANQHADKASYGS